MNLFDDLDGVRRRALLRAHLHQLSILLLRLHQHRALGRIVAAWLFHIDVLARLQPGNRHRRMPVVGSGNRDGVHILLLENRAKVFFRRRRLAHLLLHAVGELLEYVAVHIADMRDAGSAPVRLERREMSVGAPVQADHGKVQAIVGTEDLAIAFCRRSHRQTSRPNRKCIEKLTSSNHLHFPLSGQTSPFSHALTR